MSRPRLSSHLNHRDGVAVILILLGLAGMVHHFSAKPESAAAPVHQATATTFVAPAIPRFSPTSDAARTSEAVPAMRRRLREFVIPWPNIRSLPVSDTLALLQHHWQTLPHETDAIPPATFSLSDSAAQQIAAASPPTLISLEIPGISLFTQLQLLAAQTELHLRVTEDGAVFETLNKRTYSKTKSIVLKLDGIMLERFISRAEQISRKSHNSVDEPSQHENFLAVPEENRVKGYDGYEIDLNAPHELLEFDGFINYGKPIQTTGINALGAEEQVVITDSRVTQPDFSSEMSNHRPKLALTKLFSSTGISDDRTPTETGSRVANDSHYWSANTGRLVAHGSSRTLRIATETVAAIHEAATAGAALEFATGDWQNNEPPKEPAPDSSKTRPATTPAPNHPSEVPENKNTHQKLRFGVPISGHLPVLRSDNDFIGTQYLGSSGRAVRTSVEKIGAVFHLDLTSSIPTERDSNGDEWSHLGRPIYVKNLIPTLSVKPAQWQRIHLSAPTNNTNLVRQSLFVRIRSAVVSME